MQDTVLEEVTLFGVDSVDPGRLIAASEICRKHIRFGDVRLLSHLNPDYPDMVKIEPVTSVEAYSHFMLKKAWEYIRTPYVLVIQADGFILNPFAWSADFLQYDYIGAPWWYNDDHNVGNGGFSLRSRRLMEAVAHDPLIRDCHPEDEVLCRTFGAHLKEEGFLFAPDEVARRFSVEQEKWNGQFGFHGSNISDWEVEKFADPERHASYIELFYQHYPDKRPGVISIT